MELFNVSSNKLKDESSSLVTLLISSFEAQNWNHSSSIPQSNTGLWTVEPIALFANNSLVHIYTEEALCE